MSWLPGPSTGIGQLRGRVLRHANDSHAKAALPNVSVQAHWEIGSQEDVNGTDFYVGTQELGHIHLDGEAHIPVGAALVEALVQAKLAMRFRWSAQFVVVNAADIDDAVWTFALRHAQIAGVSNAELAAQIAARSNIRA